ncbi:MAG: zinc metalloprotease HtpX [Dehalococcoidia bacterium]
MTLKNNIGKDHALTLRMIFTGFLLFLTYIALFGILLFTGLPFGFVLIMGIGMVFFQYFFSDWLVLKTTRAKEVSESEAPKLHEIVTRLSLIAGIPKPRRIAIMDIEAPNAFATGRNKKKATIAVTTGLLNKLTDQELEGVIGHELAHIKNRDVAVMTWASLIVVIAGYLMQMMFWMSLFGGFGGGGRRGNGGQVWLMIMLAYVSIIVIYFISQLLTMALSRYRELAADRDGALITGNPMALASALQKISGQISKIPERDLRQVEHANAFFIIPALQGKSVAKLMSSHPDTEERIKRLRSIKSMIG